MGNSTSLTVEETNRIQVDTKFSVRNIKRIHKRFSKLDKAEKGYISPNDFATMPEINKSTLKKGTRMADALSTPDRKQIDFPKFIKTLSDYHYDNITEKCQFLFQIYDVDGDGFVGNEDLFTIMKTMVGQDLSDAQVRDIVEKTIHEMDEDKDGKLNFPEFMKALQASLPGDM